jgi:hypothetical protein
VGEELIVYQVGMIPSKYYGVFGAQDTSAFTTLTLAAVGIVSAVALVCRLMTVLFAVLANLRLAGGS